MKWEFWIPYNSCMSLGLCKTLIQSALIYLGWTSHCKYPRCEPKLRPSSQAPKSILWKSPSSPAATRLSSRRAPFLAGGPSGRSSAPATSWMAGSMLSRSSLSRVPPPAGPTWPRSCARCGACRGSTTPTWCATTGPGSSPGGCPMRRRPAVAGGWPGAPVLAGGSWRRPLERGPPGRAAWAEGWCRSWRGRSAAGHLEWAASAWPRRRCLAGWGSFRVPTSPFTPPYPLMVGLGPGLLHPGVVLHLR
mmetsp:Transcript_37081/g.64374  ORF Transcript_37081/g.64374 Transcript_37081/m.64374 type:complete len:248 (+) Transcript_37081:267-1010(+)